mgnify:CR=1 FL=1
MRRRHRRTPYGKDFDVSLDLLCEACGARLPPRAMRCGICGRAATIAENASRPYLTAQDFARLEHLVHVEMKADALARAPLLAKLAAARVVGQGDVPPDTATLGSRVRYRLGGEAEEPRYLVMPDRARDDGYFLSVASLMGALLIGERAGWCCEFARGSEMLMLELAGVEFQPEAEARRFSNMASRPDA